MLLKFVLSLLAFIGFLALVWLVGPIVSIGDSQPFAGIWIRSTLSVLIFALVFGPLAWRWWKVHKA